ncbi:PDZ domain-containing protein [Niallia nealsonii]|uniref:PDZ domain-containing protein n=1 Tax=Niallia nealsonii TaxID=115979 RepID=A0A2N0YXS0_9BACI|nr:PDZ domain-containing protein [Niallia nealsonii]PKG22052.1 PDZ domain-containing protein [Niallia nealsonii]
MGQDVLFEIFKGAGKLFLNPIFYLSFFFAAYLGVARVKRERKQFTVRAENAYFELKQVLKTGLIIGLCLSVLSILFVVVVPMEMIIYIGLFTCLLSLISKTRFLSSVYTVGLGILLSILSLYLDWDFFLFSKSNLDSNLIIFPTAIILLGLLIVAEGILIKRNGAHKTSPRLIKSKRGQYIGVHLSERIWLLPLFLFIPNGILTSPIEGWPIFTVGNQTYSLLLVPFLLGFKQEVQGVHPITAIRTVGKNTIFLGVIITLSAIGVYFYLPVAYASILLAIIGREWITSRQKNREKTKSFYFSRKNNGVMILGIVPDSPADKMGLKIGELITKVNSIPIHDEIELYKALQKNSAHCKIEVLDARGENRFVQRALYEGDHHELGLLLIQDHKQEGNAAV